MSEGLSERELLRRAESQRRYRPGDDEFDRIMADGYAVPAFFVLWVAAVRGWRSIVRRDRKTLRTGQGDLQQSLQQLEPETYHPPRRPLWTVGPKPLPESDRERLG
jgi:hypothetical protein